MKQKNKIKVTVLVLMILTLVIGVSYAWITIRVTGKKTQEIDAGVASLILTEEENGIMLENAFPVADALGRLEDSFDFNIYNESTIDLEYTVYLKNDTLATGETRMSDNKIRTYLVKNGEEGVTESLSSLVSDSNGRVLDNGVIAKGERIYYSLNLWIDENVTEIADCEVFKTKVYVEGTQIVPKNIFVEAEITGGSIIGERSYTAEKGDTKVFTMKPNEGYTLGSVYCTNEQEPTFDEESNTLTVANIQRNTLCQIVYAYDYSCDGTNNFSECLENNLETTGMLTTEHDTTTQMIANTDYRFVGADPNNYTYFNCKDGIDYTDKTNYNSTNCELWRIIGSFDVDDGTGNYEKRIKLIRSETFGTVAWNSGGQNTWANASLMKIYNTGDYYNKAGIYTEIGLTEYAKAKIADAKYYLGGSNTNTITPDAFYEKERGDTVISGREINWIGKVGLMYATDYAYATKNASCKKSMGSKDCMSGNWLYKGEDEWTLSPSFSGAGSAYRVSSSGEVNGSNYFVSSAFLARPVVYLKSDIKRTSGLGTAQKPYILE